MAGDAHTTKRRHAFSAAGLSGERARFPATGGESEPANPASRLAGAASESEEDAGDAPVASHAILSAIIITKNEEKHIGTALASLIGLADEIILVDSGSTDRTVEIAQKFTETIFTHPFDSFGAQKNFARQQTSGEWILHIDADEEVSPELVREIRAVITSASLTAAGPAVLNADFFFLPIVTEFLGRPLAHMQGANLRLFRKAAGRWDQKKVHEQVERTRDETTVCLDDSDTRLLSTPLTHHSHYQTLAAYRERQERYTSADAQEILTTGRDRLGDPVSVNPRNPFSVGRFFTERAAKQFLRKFFRQKGFLDGWRGWLWCALSAEYEVKMCRKYLALLREREARMRNEEVGK